MVSLRLTFTKRYQDMGRKKTPHLLRSARFSSVYQPASTEITRDISSSDFRDRSQRIHLDRKTLHRLLNGDFQIALGETITRLIASVRENVIKSFTPRMLSHHARQMKVLQYCRTHRCWYHGGRVINDDTLSTAKRGKQLKVYSGYESVECLFKIILRVKTVKRVKASKAIDLSGANSLI